jgi:ferredoxin
MIEQGRLTMGYLSPREKFKIPIYDDERQVTWASVDIDDFKCDGCGMCAKICPAAALRLVGKGKDKKARMVDGYHNCIGCNDCYAICDKDAIITSIPMKYTCFYKTLDHGDIAPPRAY